MQYLGSQASPFACAKIGFKRSPTSSRILIAKCNRLKRCFEDHLLVLKSAKKTRAGAVLDASSSSHRSELYLPNNSNDPPYRESNQRSEGSTPTQFEALGAGVMLETSSSDTDSDTAGTCCICLSFRSYRDDPIVFCDGPCGCGVHVSCYSLFPGGNVTDDDFYCESCADLKQQKQRQIEERRAKKRSKAKGSDVKDLLIERPTCVLCFKKKGLMKRGVFGDWVHPICVLFTPELTVNASDGRANNLDSLHPERKDLVCALCKEFGGACVQCCNQKCFTAYHPFCAYESWKQMVIRLSGAVRSSCQQSNRHASSSSGDCEDGEVSYELFCDKHKSAAVDDGTITSWRISLKNSRGDQKRLRQRQRKLERSDEQHVQQRDEREDDEHSEVFTAGIRRIPKGVRLSKCEESRVGSGGDGDGGEGDFEWDGNGSLAVDQSGSRGSGFGTKSHAQKNQRQQDSRLSCSSQYQLLDSDESPPQAVLQQEQEQTTVSTVKIGKRCVIKEMALPFCSCTTATA